MKKIIACFVAVLMSTNIWAQKDKDEDDLVYRLDHKVIEGYKLKATIEVSKGLSYWLVTDEEQFDNMFVTDGDESAKIQRPDFNTQYVFAIAAPETRYQTYLAYKKVEVVNEKDVNVHCVKMEDYKQGFKYVPVLIGTVPKTPFVKNIVFCNEDGKEEKRYSLNKIDKEKQKLADKQIKAEKEAAEKAEKEVRLAAEKAEKEKRQAKQAAERAAKEKAEALAEEERLQSIEAEKAAAKAEKQKQKELAAKERQEREERELKMVQEREEREARLEEARLKKERMEAKLQAEEEAKERAEIEKEKEQIRKEREERRKKRKAQQEEEEE